MNTTTTALAFIILFCFSCVPKRTDSTGSAVIVDKNSKLAADMSFDLGASHGTLMIQGKTAQVQSELSEIRACIGEPEPCRVGSAKTWLLIKKGSQFEFPVKISLLRNVKVQVEVKTNSRDSFKEEITITDDWSKEIASKVLTTNNRISSDSASFGLNGDFWSQLNQLFVQFDQPQGTASDSYQDNFSQPTYPQDSNNFGNTVPEPNSIPNIDQGTGSADSALNQPVEVDLFNQGATNHCWGYSSLHALKQYYANEGVNDPDYSAWRSAINKYDDTSFRTYMDQSVNPSNSFGNAQLFITAFVRDHNLPSGVWNVGFSADQTISRIKEGTPSASCDGAHCVAFLKIGQDGTMTVGDSSGGYTYQENQSALYRYSGFLTRH